MNLLSRLRVGECTDDNICIVRSLILNHPECPKTDFESLPWSKAILITTRHTVREAWNAASLDRHCRMTGNIKYIVPSEDQITGTHQTLNNNIRHFIVGMNEKDTKKLADRIEIAIGMKAMILFNLSTDADIANGTRGIIKDIILDPQEETMEVNNDLTVKLKYPPAIILFEPEGGSQISSVFVDKCTRHPITVPNGQIPITSCMVTFHIILKDGSQYTILWRQYTVTGGCALTDIKSQGQTMGPIVVDLRNPPTGQISPFSAYVALSHSRGRNSICLLSDFDEKLFKSHPSADLAIEMEHLEALASKF